MTVTSKEASVESVDLRTRRKLQTEHDIHRAALELFERYGARTTTVQQIADAAGVSHRTFFRYFTSKEEAALPVQRTLIDAIDELEFPSSDPSVVFETIETMIDAVMSAPDPSDMEDHRRISYLLANDPDFGVAATVQEKVLVDRLLARLAEQRPDCAGPTGLLMCETALMEWRVAWRHWGESARRGTTRDPVEVYRECRTRLRHIVR